ncbi:FliH/SctL family protein [Dyadobacter aurulentus]|uniref:hypothetical protein n=1 Tax=Dyadobacter sp. UC 10 TaxID=2605428 RepID=UPI0011F32DA9|nr:hypothetical protein [Dyadobacter sp. UC 10]KAA0989266.1 hypothetical protein FXO21_03365 [Dyadobacter sp. UC 10]
MTLPEITYPFLNWRDGMKITQRHLVAHDHAIRDAIRDATAIFLNGHNYGLLPAVDNSGAGIQLRVLGDTIQMLSCRAITPGGIRVEWDAGADPDSVSLSLMDYKNRLGNAGIFYVVLRISLSSLTETGEYDLEEQPLRKPFVTLKPMLELLSVHEKLSDAYSMPIFRIRFEGQMFSPDYDYIPPSAGVFGENLLWYYETCGKQINSIHQTAILILKKINGMQNQSPVARDIYQISEKLVFAGLEIIDHYRLISKDLPPIHFIQELIRYARTMRTAIDCLSENNANRFYQYLRNNVAGTTKFNTHYGEVTKSVMDSMIDSVLTSPYYHNDCSLLLDNVKGYLDFIDFVFQNLLALPYVDAGKWDIA